MVHYVYCVWLLTCTRCMLQWAVDQRRSLVNWWLRMLVTGSLPCGRWTKKGQRFWKKCLIVLYLPRRGWFPWLNFTRYKTDIITCVITSCVHVGHELNCHAILSVCACLLVSCARVSNTSSKLWVWLTVFIYLKTKSDKWLFCLILEIYLVYDDSRFLLIRGILTEPHWNQRPLLRYPNNFMSHHV